jgi:hypothetical protein
LYRFNFIILQTKNLEANYLSKLVTVNQVNQAAGYTAIQTAAWYKCGAVAYYICNAIHLQSLRFVKVVSIYGAEYVELATPHPAPGCWPTCHGGTVSSKP